MTSPRIKYLFVALAVISLAGFLAALFLPFSVRQSFIGQGFGLLGVAVSAAICVLIVFQVGAMHRTQKALVHAESEAKASAGREQFVRNIIDNVPNMIGYWGRDLRCRYANNAYSEWFGIPPEKIVGMLFRDLTGEKLFAMNEVHIERALAGEPQRFERTLVKVNGSVGHIIGHYIPDVDADGEVRGFSIQASEVTVLKETEAKLKLAACVFENTLDGVLITDVNGTIISVNPGFTAITGYTPEDAVGKTPRILQSNRHDQAFYIALWKAIENDGQWHGEVWNRRKGGELYLQRMTISMVRSEDGEPMRYVSVFSDITTFWRKDEQIKHLAFHDALTDLPNRTLLMDRIDQKLLSARREKSHFALMFLDLDGFKRVNDQLGHHVGDDLLKSVALRLLALVRKSDTVARVGGDEFIFILNSPQGKDDITDVANRIVSSISEPIEILGSAPQIGVSVGIAMFPEHGDTATDLIRHADVAMYAAKSLGKNNIRFFPGDNEAL
jgi:two-component system CheB/CheR fusion protein